MGLQASLCASIRPKRKTAEPTTREPTSRSLIPEPRLYLIERSDDSNDGSFRSLIDTWARSTSEALAEALGLDSAYGEDNPDEPGDYLPSPVDPTKIDWEKLAKLEGCEWHAGVTVEVIKDLVAKGYSIEFSPSY